MMMRIHTLYGTQGSGSAAIEVALIRAGVNYKLVRASSWESDSAVAQLAKHNPLKQIPTLVLPDGSVQTESAAILIHLGLTYPAAKLLPANPAKRAHHIRGLVFIAANCYSAISIGDYPQRWSTSKDKTVHESVRQAARKQLQRYWEIFADSFAATPYLGGRSPAALDFLAAVVSKWYGTRPHLRQARPAFLQTLEKIEQHAVVAPVFARHWPG